MFLRRKPTDEEIREALLDAAQRIERFKPGFLWASIPSRICKEIFRRSEGD